MKSFLNLLTLALIALPSVSHALVVELANCATRDGSYNVEVQDNQGTGLHRTSNIVALIRDANGDVLATYAAELYQGLRSVSFGRPQYQDVATGGQRFVLAGPSTNLRRYDFQAVINGAPVEGENLKCTVFGGRVLN